MNPGLKRILLAEDNPMDAELALSALEEQRVAHEIIVVQDGADALDYLLQRGSYALLREMKPSPELRTIPVVMLTSSREEQDLIRSYQAGVNAYVVKPVDFQQYVEAVRKLGQFWAHINEPPPPPRYSL